MIVPQAQAPLTRDGILLPELLDRLVIYRAALVSASFTPVRTEADRIMAAHMNPLV
jgi:hypothetical protein